MSNNTNYTTLALAAATGAMGALVAQYVAQLISNYISQPSLVSKRRSTLISGDKRTVRAICFDMDGTLIQTELIWFKLLESALEHFGYHRPDFTYNYWLPHFGQSMEQNVSDWFPGLEVSKLDQFCHQNYHKYVDLVEIIENAPQIIQFANEITDNKTYITTNCPRAIVEMILNSPKGQFLRTSFANPDGTLRILCPADLSQITRQPVIPKPSANMVQEVCSYFGVSTGDCILLGDSVYDIECINSAGGLGIQLVQHQGQKEDDDLNPLHDPYLKIASLSEFYQIQQLFIFPTLNQ